MHVEEADGGGAQFVVALPAAGWTGREDDEADDDADEQDGPEEGTGDSVAAALEGPSGSDAGESGAAVRG